MTNEEAVSMIEAKLECLQRSTSGSDIMCNARDCDNCELNYAQGNIGEQKEWLKMAIKALEQKPVLDKIRAEIEELDEYYDNDYFSGNKDAMYKCNEVLEIIDKYKEIEKYEQRKISRTSKQKVNS